jgi:hypothetical protein
MTEEKIKTMFALTKWFVFYCHSTVNIFYWFITQNEYSGKALNKRNEKFYMMAI